MMNRHKSMSLADYIFEKLENDILSGVYPYGEILTESGLSEQLGVSRTPIREAIKRLEQENLVNDVSKGVEVLGITKKDIDDIFEIRVRLEGLAARWAAENASPEDKNHLKEVIDLQDFYTGRSDAEHIKDMDSDFHYSLYVCCGSPVLSNTLIPLHKKVQQYRKTSVSNGSRAQRSVEEHRAILEAVLAGDGEKADQMMIEHIRNARESILSRRKQNWD